jgi:hypothetical protein
MENTELNTLTTETEQKVVETIKIKFSRKLARAFTSKNGKDMVAIAIPNEDPDDKRSWEEFVLPVTMVHCDHYGSKTLWVKLPADGTTTLSRSEKPVSEDGEWTREERTVDNKTLKSMVEAYKLKPKSQNAR